jgi:sulfur carrier protein
VPPKPSAHETDGGPSAAIALRVNGEEVRVAGPCTVTSLLAQLGLAGRRVAVAVDREVVPRSAFDQHQLAAGDRVEILEAVGGG